MSKELESFYKIKDYGPVGFTKEEYVDLVNNVLVGLKRLEEIENAKPSDAMECFKEIETRCKYDYEYGDICYDYKEELSTIKQALLKAQDQEKENEVLKEIIKSFFDRGCPLHQYIDKDFGLTIEVDSECSIMHLGEFKGVDLDKKLKDILE